MPALYILAGSNGAGKSTVGPSFLPPDILDTYTVFDGDKLFLEKKSELWKTGLRVPKEAKRIANEFVVDTFASLVDTTIQQHSHFIYEGHFTEDSSWDTPKRFKDLGYELHMIYMGLSSPDLSQLRVTKRALEGKHNVPRLEIDNNFYGNLYKLNQNFQIFNSLQIFDTSEFYPQLLLHLQENVVVYHIESPLLPVWFTNYLPDIHKCI